MRPTILVTNDDGWSAPGLEALAAALTPLGRVVVVAPERPRSAVSHQITLHKPLRVWQERTDWFVCSGSPADCVYLGVHSVCAADRPQLVVSGINRGSNLGTDVFYSGTVAGAMEGLMTGVPAIASSQHLPVATEFYGAGLHPKTVDYSAAAELTRRAAVQVIERGLPEKVMLNINVPSGYDVAGGLTVASLGRRYYDEGTIECVDPRGKPYYWVGGSESGHDETPGTDSALVYQGHATITPILADMTHRAFMDDLGSWEI